MGNLLNILALCSLLYSFIFPGILAISQDKEYGEVLLASLREEAMSSHNILCSFCYDAASDLNATTGNDDVSEEMELSSQEGANFINGMREILVS